MKTYAKYTTRLLHVICIALALVFSSCKLDPPEPLSDEELFIRAFIKNFGLISSDQTWNVASRSSVTIIPDDHADSADVYVAVSDEYYLVAHYEDIDAPTCIDIDVPQGASSLAVDIDGEVYFTSAGASVDASSSKSRSSSVSHGDLKISASPLSWLLIAEDLGSVEEFDFNDVIIKISSVASRRRDILDSECRVITLTAMAAGGTLPVYVHFKDSATDMVLGPDGAVSVSDEGALSKCEWHKWFRNASTLPFSSTTMVNTGHHSVTASEVKSLSFATSADFSLAAFSRREINGTVNDPDYYSKVFQTDIRDASAISGFYITVGAPRIEDCISVLYSGTVGVPPQMILIPDLPPVTIEGVDGWMWPSERVDIRKVYPEFSSWISDPSVDWYLRPNPLATSLLYRY